MLKVGGDILYGAYRFSRGGFMVVAMLLMLFSSASGFEMDGAILVDGSAGTVVEMSLEECIKTALSQNPDIEIQEIDVISAEQNIVIEEAAFDSAYSTAFAYGDSKRPSASIVNGNHRKVTSFSFGLDGRRKDGDSYSLSVSQVKSDTNSTFSALNPSYTMDLSLSYVQPLGRGRGKGVVLSQLKISRLDKDISQLQLEQDVMDQVNNVEGAYWQLVYAGKVLEARKESLSLAEATLDRTKGMIDSGALAESEILLVQSQLASRREDAISAEGNLSRAVLNLKLTMRIATGSGLWGEEIKPSGSSVEMQKISTMPFEAGLQTALKNRPDYLENQKDLEAAGIRIESAKDRIKPSIDLQATVGVGGLKDNYSRSLQDITSLEYPSWEVGLWMDSPVGRRDARARLAQRVNDEKKAKLEIEKSIQDIAADIAGAEITLRTSSNRVDAAAVAREYAEKKFSEEEEKHALGIATTHDVLEYQEDLALARMNEYSAIVEYNMAVSDYYLALGIILEKKRIRFNSGDLSKPVNPYGGK